MYRQLFRFVFLLLPVLTGRELFCQDTEFRILQEIHLNRNRSLDPVARRISQSAAWLSIGLPFAAATADYFQSDPAPDGTGLALMSGSALCLGSVLLVKNLVRQPRPFNRYPEIQPPYGREAGFTFPSGHTAAAFTTATGLTLIKPRWYVAGPAFLWAGAVGWSRIHLGQHYPGDVLAGALTGSACAWLGWQLRRWWSDRLARCPGLRRRKPSTAGLPPGPAFSFSDPALPPLRPLSMP